MMQMKSTLSDDAENDSTYASSNESRISPGSHGLRSSLSIGRSADIHRRHIGSNTNGSSVNPHLELVIRTNSKYGKRESQTRSRGRWNKMALFIILPIVSCFIGFFWMLSSLGASSSHHLRHENLHDNLTQTRASILSSVITKKQLDSRGRVDKRTGYTHKDNAPRWKDQADRMGGISSGSKTNQMGKSTDTTDAQGHSIPIGTTFWKTFIEADGSEKEYRGTIDFYESKTKLYTILYEDGDTEELAHKEVVHLLKMSKNSDHSATKAATDNESDLGQKSSLNVLDSQLSEKGVNKSNLDSFHFASGSHYEKEYHDNSNNSTGQYQIPQSHHTVHLHGWTNFAANRVFPLAHETHDQTKNIDPDYGEIAYKSLKNKHVFARLIPSNDDGVAPGGFDPNFESPSRKRRTKKNGEASGKHHYGRTEKLDIKAENVTPSQLSAYFDDDRVRITTYTNDDGEDDDKDDDKSVDGKSADTKKVQAGACRAMEWEFGYYPTCNEFHTIDVSRPYDDPADTTKPRPENSMMKISYINHGHYRDVFIIEDNPWIWPSEYKTEHLNRPNVSFGVLDEDKVSERITKAYRSAVLKTFSWERKLDQEHREMVNIEAVVMERLRKSPRIMDIYGHCGYSVTAEVVPIEFEEVAVYGEGYKSRKAVEKRNKNGIRPYNNFTAEEKLGFALTMAESLADLHGFSDGVIVHDDVQMCQWLRLPDGTMKLGDFNRASIMEYDLVNGNYCKFNNGGAFGNYRAPEEFDEKDLDEKIDVFSFGNNIYAMLTGLWGFYDISDDQVTQEKLTDGDLPYIDPRWKERSYIERRLVELMEKCWIFDPDERVDIFFAVEFLKETVREYNKLKTHNSY